MEIVAVTRVFFCLKPEFITCAVACSAPDAPACQPGGVGARVMIPAFTLSRGLSAELRRPNHKCFIEQTSLLEIFDQRCDASVIDGAMFAMVYLEVFVGVPVGPGGRDIVGTAKDLNKSHPAFHQATSHQALPPKRFDGGIMQPVKFLGSSRFLRQVGHIGGAQLQTCGEFKRLDSGGQFSIFSVGLMMLPIEPLN